MISAIDNVRRWPGAVGIARIVFPWGAPLFGFLGVTFTLLAGLGLILGLQTPIAALLAAVFLIPTFDLQRRQLRTLPGILKNVEAALSSEEAKRQFRPVSWHAIHARHTGLENNLVLLFTSLFFSVRGSVAFGIDNLFEQWVIRLF